METKKISRVHAGVVRDSPSAAFVIAVNQLYLCPNRHRCALAPAVADSLSASAHHATRYVARGRHAYSDTVHLADCARGNCPET